MPLYRIDAAGGGVAERVVGGTRQVTGFSASADGAVIAFTATDDTSPADVFACRADGRGERQLTDLNRDWKAAVALARPERFRFERAGFTVDGWVMPPAGSSPVIATPRSSTSTAGRPASTATASSTSSRCTRARATPWST